MRWVLASHLLPPGHRGGVEVHTLRLGVALAERGHEVCLLATDDDPRSRPGAVRTRRLRGLEVVEIGHGRRAETPADTLGIEASTRAAFEAIAARRPDAVLFQHLMHLGLDLPKKVRSLGVPSALTLHEYWLLCARGGQLRDREGALCEGPEPARCESCLRGYRFGRGRRERQLAAAAARFRSVTGFDAYRRMKGMRQRLSRSGAGPAAPAEDPALPPFLAERERRVEEALGAVDLVLAPSRYLARRFAQLRPHWPAVEVSPNGVPLPTAIPERADPGAGAILHVAYLGSVVPQKGLHVLLEAARGLERVEVHVHGDAGFDPAYRRRLAPLLGPSVHLHGPYDPFEVSARLAPAHVLVVPSLWPENAPLVLSEARSMRVPALASALGGMPELVTEGRDGHLFAAGEVSELRARLRELRDVPGQWSGLTDRIEPPRGIAAEAAFLEERVAGLRPGR